MTHITHRGPGRDYYLRKLEQNKTEGEARRALKRQISNVVYHHLLTDAANRATIGGQ